MSKTSLQGLRPSLTERKPEPDQALAALAMTLDKAARRSLTIRAVDAGSCDSCELEIHGLNNAFDDLERTWRATPISNW
jgi:hypothetical protein